MGGGHQGGYMGWWGSFQGARQKGITTYSLSSFQQRALAGAAHNAVFNTFRRVKNQFLYFVPPFIGAYYIYTWANAKNEYYNSKAGHAELAEH
ncbi:Cytochrome b-c1 complex subunit 8, mitochondrial [Savitreella phatthalungensis]